MLIKRLGWNKNVFDVIFRCMGLETTRLDHIVLVWIRNSRGEEGQREGLYLFIQIGAKFWNK